MIEKALSTGETETFEYLIFSIATAKNRHENTNYDDYTKKDMTEDQVKEIRKEFSDKFSFC